MQPARSHNEVARRQHAEAHLDHPEEEQHGPAARLALVLGLEVADREVEVLDAALEPRAAEFGVALHACAARPATRLPAGARAETRRMCGCSWGQMQFGSAIVPARSMPICRHAM